MIRRNYLKSLIIFILTCLPLLGASAQQKVTVNVVNASLKQVFSTIENQTSYRFSYKSDIIDYPQGYHHQEEWRSCNSCT